MRPDKKRARAKNKLAELLGIEAPDNPTGPTAARIRDDNSREAEAVLDFLVNPKHYRNKECRHCGKSFTVNRANVALCSDYCREKELAAVGITWRWDRTPDQRWYYAYDGDPRSTEPLVIGPEATEMLRDLPTNTDDSTAVSVSSAADTDSGSLDDDFLFSAE